MSAGVEDINIIDLGTLPKHITSEARDINNLGEVIGESDGFACYWSIGREIQYVDTASSSLSITLLKINELSQVNGWYDPSGIYLPFLDLKHQHYLFEYRPFIWTPLDGQFDLGTLLRRDQGKIISVNDLGQAVGWTRAFTGYQRAFLWTSEGGVTDLGTLGGNSSKATDINNLGQIIGYSHTMDGKSRAFIWTQDSGMEDIGTLGGDNTYPVDINNLGQVVGTAETDLSEVHVFLWTSGDGMIDIGSLGYGYCFANKINDQGYIIGGVSDGLKGPYHAFLWTQESDMSLIAPVDYFASKATDVNNLGQIVGYYNLHDNPRLGRNAFLWTPEEGFKDLGTLGGVSSVAWGINDFGQVVGSSDTENSQRHAVIWELPSQTTSIIIIIIDDLVEEGELNAGQGRALTAKLESAIKLMNEGKFITARNLLLAFINKVNHLIDTGELSQEEGELLITYAQKLLDSLGSQKQARIKK